MGGGFSDKGPGLWQAPASVGAEAEGPGPWSSLRAPHIGLRRPLGTAAEGMHPCDLGAVVTDGQAPGSQAPGSSGRGQGEKKSAEARVLLGSRPGD